MNSQKVFSRMAISFFLAVLVLIFALPPYFVSQALQRSRRVYTNDDVASGGGGTSAAAAAPSAGESPAAAPAAGERVAPFVPTPMGVVEKMLDLAKVTAADVVYDLGSGDGRIVMMAAEKYGAKAVGVELDEDLARESQEEVARRKLDKLVTIVQGDLFQTNVQPATVVAVYLLQAANRKLSPILEKDLKPGTRVVAHDIRIPDWYAAEEVSLNESGVLHHIYLYRVPQSFRK